MHWPSRMGWDEMRGVFIITLYLKGLGRLKKYIANS